MEKEIAIRFRLDEEDQRNLSAFVSLYASSSDWQTDLNSGVLEAALEQCMRFYVKRALSACVARDSRLLESERRGDKSGVPFDFSDGLATLVCLLAAKFSKAEKASSRPDLLGGCLPFGDGVTYEMWPVLDAVLAGPDVPAVW